MKLRILPIALVLCLAPVVSAQGDNPFRKAKVGDWVNYKLNATIGEFTVPGEMMMTVTAKDDKEATLKLDLSIMGKKESTDRTINLTKPYDPTELAGIGGGGALKGLDIKQDGAGGAETIEIGGKKYDTSWIKLKMSGKAGGTKLDADVKIWMSKTVPLAGMVKMDMNSNILKMTMEMTGSGSK